MLRLQRVSSECEFSSLVEQHQPKTFIHYRDLSAQKQNEVRSLLHALGITQMSGMCCLDIGPGYGDSLDVWKSLGAEAHFIEKDPWFSTYNRVKGYMGWCGNHLWGMRHIPPHSFDFIWSRGAISHQGTYLKLTRQYGLAHWLDSIYQLTKCRSVIVIAPYRGTTRWMQEIFLSRKYVCMAFIENHNSHLYPETWVLRRSA